MAKDKLGKCREKGCQETPTQYSQDVEQTRDEEGNLGWEVTDKHAYCGLHFKPGKMTILDGKKTMVIQTTSRPIQEME